MRGVKRDWEKLDKLYKESNLSIYGFCSKYNIPDSTLRGHLNRVAKSNLQKSDELPEIIPIDIITDSKVKSNNSNKTDPINLRVNNVEISLHEGFNKELLKEVLDVLRSLC